MAPRLISPERILSTRMLLHVPADSAIRFSVLDFPYANTFKAFMDRFESIYHHKHDKTLPFNLRPPFRQLNDALLTLAPGLIQAFEYAFDGEQGKQRMVAFTRYHGNEQGETCEDFPSQEQLQSLIRHWLERWGEHPEVQPLLKSDGQAAWQTLMNAFNNAPETDWEHGIAPAELSADLNSVGGLSYIVLPALLTSLLHMKKMTIDSEKGTYPILWRRVNEGGKNGLYLVSQPFPFEGDYFAYCLDFSVQTQTGHIDPHGQQDFWIFAHLSIQRYITERFRKENQGRNISILVGYNREHFISGWDEDTTLIRLPVEKIKGEWVWESGVGKLLDDFSVRKLLSPNDILTSPRKYGNYTGNNGIENEYYPIFAEGHKFGEERGRAHRVKTGTSLRERSQIMVGILSLLKDWLEVSAPLERDIQNPKNTLALRNYEYMVDETRDDNSEQEASWCTALQTSLSNIDKSHVHIVLLHRSPLFQEWANKQLDETLMKANKGDDPLAIVTYQPIEPMLYTSLDSGGFDSKSESTKRRQQLRESYSTKVNEWRKFLQKIQWRPNSRRLVLIDSTGEFDVPYDQQIKGAVREACIREGISSQFLVGNLKLDSNPEAAGKLDGGSAGRLQNAVLDLTVRQQGILYAPPREIYELAAKLGAETAAQLDVIAFCRIKRTKFAGIQYVLAVRLRASGEVDVLLPGKDMDWLPCDTAAYQVGNQLADSRAAIQRKGKPNHPFHLDHSAMVNFVEHVLTKRLEHPTIAVIEAEGWRNGRGSDEQKYCWTQLRNTDLFKNQDVLNFGTHRVYQRTNPILDPLLGVVRLRMNNETPQYTTADDWKSEDEMRDIEHLTGYVDRCVTNPMHYMSIAGLSKAQKDQKGKKVREAFKGDAKGKYDNLAYKHPQIVELVPFFVHPRFQNDEGLRQICRCIHFLRISPGFTMSEIVLPYPMHLGKTLVDDLLCIVGLDD